MAQLGPTNETSGQLPHRENADDPDGGFLPLEVAYTVLRERLIAEERHMNRIEQISGL
jgi:hypothetical protein